MRYQVPGATDYSPHGPKTATAGKRMADPKVSPNRFKNNFFPVSYRTKLNLIT